MTETWKDIPGTSVHKGNDPEFPNAPEGWRRSRAERQAREEGLTLGDDHWQVVRAIQEYFAKNEVHRVRELHDALDEKFHSQGGIRYLYLLFPGLSLLFYREYNNKQSPSFLGMGFVSEFS